MQQIHVELIPTKSKLFVSFKTLLSIPKALIQSQLIHSFSNKFHASLILFCLDLSILKIKTKKQTTRKALPQQKNQEDVLKIQY